MGGCAANPNCKHNHTDTHRHRHTDIQTDRHTHTHRRTHLVRVTGFAFSKSNVGEFQVNEHWALQRLCQAFGLKSSCVDTARKQGRSTRGCVCVVSSNHPTITSPHLLSNTNQPTTHTTNQPTTSTTKQTTKAEPPTRCHRRRLLLRSQHTHTHKKNNTECGKIEEGTANYRTVCIWWCCVRKLEGFLRFWR